MLSITLQPRAPDEGTQLVVLAVWRTLGGPDAAPAVRVDLAWAALGLCLPLGIPPMLDDWDLLAYGRRIRATLGEMGAEVSASMLAEAVQLAIAGAVAIPGLAMVESATAPADDYPSEPPEDAGPEERLDYARRVMEYNARKAG